MAEYAAYRSRIYPIYRVALLVGDVGRSCPLSSCNGMYWHLSVVSQARPATTSLEKFMYSQPTVLLRALLGLAAAAIGAS